jgi:hypothetical protein
MVWQKKKKKKKQTDFGVYFHVILSISGTSDFFNDTVRVEKIIFCKDCNP